MEYLAHDWDQQREQLSALLDNELNEQEREQLAAHLRTCSACRAELESMRRARALVRALPQPALPRSFALPIAVSPAPATPHQAASAGQSAPASGRSASARPTPIRSRRGPLRALQWLSAIAAVLGIVLLLASAFPSFSFRGFSTTASNSAQAPENAGRTEDAASSTPSPVRTPATQPGIDTPAPTAAPPSSTPGTALTGGDAASPAAGSSAGPPTSVTGLGILLLLLSACGFAITWAIRRRGQRLNG